MTIDDLHITLNKLPCLSGYVFHGTNVTDYTTYRKFYRFQVEPINKNRKSIQKYLEKYRPTVDYIILPDTSILVGYSQDFVELKQAALELMTKRLAEKQKESLKYHEDLLQTAIFYKTAEPFATTFPELVI